MKVFSIKEIRDLGPCYDPVKYLAEGWQGTALDILDMKQVPFADRLWVLMRTDFVSEKLIRLFAVWCARQVQHLMTDARSIKAIDVAEAFANGTASREEMTAAGDDAWDAAWAAAGAAAWAAAGAAAWAAAWAAAGAAAWAAAGAAAGAVAWAAQETKLREMLIAGKETGDTK